MQPPASKFNVLIFYLLIVIAILFIYSHHLHRLIVVVVSCGMPQNSAFLFFVLFFILVACMMPHRLTVFKLQQCHAVYKFSMFIFNLLIAIATFLRFFSLFMQVDYCFLLQVDCCFLLCRLIVVFCYTG